MLPFLSHILDDLYPPNNNELSLNDGLLIMGKGLGLNLILKTMIQWHADPQNLVFLLNTSPEEAASLGITQNVTNATPPQKRQELYLKGGCLNTTSRILVVDMLNNVVPLHLVSGIIVNHCHLVKEASVISFILRLYREQNKIGFIKALSDEPYLFVNSKLDRILKTLLIRHVYLWPRFHMQCIQDIEQAGQIELVELRVPLSRKMKDIQAGLVECLNDCLGEIKRAHSQLDVDQIKLEQSFFQNFDHLLRSQLEPVWHLLPFKVRQMTNDVTTLRKLLHYLVGYDPVTFNWFLDTVFASNAAALTSNRVESASTWITWDAADIVFNNASARVYLKSKQQSELVLEPLPKWKVFLSILDEIEAERQSGNILVMTSSKMQANQLREIVSTRSHDKLLNRLFTKYSKWKKSDVLKALQPESVQQPVSKRRRMRGGKTQTTREPEQQDDLDILSQGLQIEDDTTSAPDYLFIEHYRVPTDQISGVTGYTGDLDASLLEGICPEHIVLFEPDMGFIRRLELFKALHPERDMKVYFIVYEDSIEEQQYLATIRKEKDAFEKLIQQKKGLVIPVDQDGRVVVDPEELFFKSVDTRVAGGQVVPLQKPQVLVDLREFRATLPFLVHAKRMKVIPCTLQVGDYILSSNICLERKSISDLVQSLKNGRLYNQCEAMFQHYTTCILLIEFDPDRAFRFLSQKQGPEDIASRLALLCIHFPKLRFVWSPSLETSAEIFEIIKREQPEPDLQKAVSIGTDSTTQRAEFNPTPMSVLRALPGINHRNYKHVMTHVKNLRGLSEMTLPELKKLIGEEDARSLFKFMHEKKL
ncbi:hypothetical protein EDD86DRAFT_194941 [Gorgonomyces haynaldii]|nr:hypothetical protein EDD86DRAFT_194941 [Gorgonomyces haynaldii]